VHYDLFQGRWKNSGGAERANYVLFLQDLCALLGVAPPTPTTANPTEDAYVLERAVQFNDGAKKSTGRIDLYKRGCFVLETKQGTDSPDAEKQAQRAELGLAPEKRRKGHALRGTAKWEQMMQAARQQALGYVRALPTDEPRPLFILVADVGCCIDVYANFTGVGDAFTPFPDQSSYRLHLPDLAEEKTRVLLRQIFTDPQALDPSRKAARVTRELAGYLAGVSAQLERAGHDPEIVAQFLMRCLFTMFAEDTKLIPEGSFTKMLREYSAPELQASLPDALQDLWQKMDVGGFSPEFKTKVRRFNGKLFHNASTLPLTADQISLLLKAAEADWKEVEPAIFGTLLERALDPKERHRLGAHYTPRRYVERLIIPTVLDPLRREWAAVQAASARRLDEGNAKAARGELERFLRRLTSLRILDPACGSGNFLYVTLEHLKRLEGEVLAAINSYGHTKMMDLAGGTTVSPHQFLGLELNPRAATVADVVLRIGFLQWHLRTHGLGEMREPLLDEYQNIRQQDAVLTYEGNFQNARPTEWPRADFIIGNPPFVGDKAMRGALGSDYVDTLRKAYKGTIPESADLVMYWWEKAAETVRQNQAEAFGFITTNSITQTFNRRLIQRHLESIQPLSLVYTIADHPWVDSAQGAAVRIAMSVARSGLQLGKVARVVHESATAEEDAHVVELVEIDGIVNANFTIGADVTTTKTLEANQRISTVGMGLYGTGFLVDKERAYELGMGTTEELTRRILPYMNGRDLTQQSRGLYAIDLFGLTENQVIQRFPTVYQHVYEQVKPERDKNNRIAYRKNWWIFGEARAKLRPAFSGLSRMIATSQTAKHRIFTFIPGDTVADSKLFIIALEDPFFLGILSSRIHTCWGMATGGWLGVGNDSVYSGTRSFDPFPFPITTPQQQARIRELAEQLDAHRKRQQALHPVLTLTDLYNVVEKLRAGEPLTAKDQIAHQLGLASVVLSLHQQLDAAVAEAYGWPVDLPDAEILTRLVRLNHERAREEQNGLVRYLRPSYQAPDQAQATIQMPAATTVVNDTAIAATPLPWATELAQQMQAVREAVQQAGQPLTPAQVAARFQRIKPQKVQPLLDTLAALSLLRLTEEGTYAS